MPIFCFIPCDCSRRRRVRSTSTDVEPFQELVEIAARDGPAVELGEIVEITCGGEIRVDRQLARKIANPPPRLEGVAPAVEAEHARASARRSQQVEQQPDRRRLAGAVGAEEPVDLARQDFERELLDTDHGAVVLGQAVDLDRRRVHRAACLTRASSPSAATSTSRAGIADAFALERDCAGVLRHVEDTGVDIRRS